MLIDYPITALIPNSALPELISSEVLTDHALSAAVVHAVNIPPGTPVNGYFVLGQARVAVVVPFCETKQDLRERMAAHLGGHDLSPRIAQLETELARLRSIQGARP